MTSQHPELLSAEQLVRQCYERGARIHRYHGAPRVCVLTSDPETARWLRDMGATRHHATAEDGSYERARGGLTEYDFELHTVRVREHYSLDDEGAESFEVAVGAMAIWEASRDEIPF